MDFLCSTEAPWSAAQCTETHSAEVYTGTEGREEDQCDYSQHSQMRESSDTEDAHISGYSYLVMHF